MSDENLKAVTALSRNLQNCHVCLTLNSIQDKRCKNCNSRLHSRNKFSLQNTVALLITAVILYIPANILPIMYTNYLGEKITNTIMGGVVTLWMQDSYPIAIVIFVASVMVPIAKILILAWLCYSVAYEKVRSQQRSHTLFRLTEFIGRWSMVDIFVVAVLVALIQMGNFMSILPGEAAIAFAGLVITTMIAAITFDSRLIWEPLNQMPEQSHLELPSESSNA